MPRSTPFPALALALALACFFLAAPAQAEDKGLVERAMAAELARAKSLRIEDFSAPYFVSYEMTSSHMTSLRASFGAITDRSSRYHRELYVELRVGDYKSDSSGKGGFRFSYDPDVDYDDTQRRYFGPEDDDPDAIRAQFWLATDQAYKNALAQYHAKKGKAIYQAQSSEAERFDDFSRERPRVYRGPDARLIFDEDRWAEFLRELSGELKSEKEIVEAQIAVTAEIETRYYMNTEGARIVDDAALLTFYTYGRTIADDGMELTHSVIRYARSDASVPGFADLRAQVRTVVDELKALRRAPVIDPYTGPAILDPQTTGVYFHEAIGHRLEGERMRDQQEGQTFKGKIGEAILPDFISLYDDPTLAAARGEELNGHYLYDNEGVPAERVTLVDRGVLRNLLMSRAPAPGFPRSNGHGRSDGRLDPVGRMAVTIVEPAQTVTREELKRRLIEEVKRQGKPYGLLLKESIGGETATARFDFQAFANKPTLIYKVDPTTGEETLVRGAELVGTPLISISKLLAMADDPGVFNGFCGAESGMIPVSTIAPSALVKEIELQRTSAQPKRPPILPAPF